jgi:hypothetical protein
MPCLAISSTTTAYGRQMIESTRTWVQVGSWGLCTAHGMLQSIELQKHGTHSEGLQQFAYALQ